MWVLWTFIFAVVSIWLGYTWLVALRAKYEHTAESRLILLLVAMGSCFLAPKLILQIAPQWGTVPVAVSSTAVALGLFSLLSFVVVNLWLAALTRGYDEKIVGLEEKEDDLIRRLEVLRWKALNAPAERVSEQKAVIRKASPEDETAVLRKTVHDWEGAEGTARVRALKVLEWKDETAAKGDSELKSELERLRVLAETEKDETKREQAKVRWALNKIELTTREARAKGESLGRDSQRNDKPHTDEDQMEMRQRLQDILRDMQSARAEKAEFLRSKIRLTWRRRI